MNTFTGHQRDNRERNGDTGRRVATDPDVIDDVDRDAIDAGSDDPQWPVVDFCGETVDVDRDPFVIGRRADLVLDDDNRFLHRRFLALHREGDLWFLVNVGGGTAATVSDDRRGCVATMAAGAALPLIETVYRVGFAAGPTRYEFDIYLPHRTAIEDVVEPAVDGDQTTGRVSLTPDQKLLVVALAEPVLRGDLQTIPSMPTSHDVARTLGWTISKFNRKLDNVCQKFARLGVRGLHGEVGNLASQRRERLVEHAVASRTVTTADLALLEVARLAYDH